MKRKTTACIFNAFFLVLAILLLPVTVFAQDTTLTTEVPTKHILYLELKGNGTVIVDGTTYAKSAEIEVKRHSKPIVSIKMDAGTTLRTLAFNGKNIADQLVNGTLVLPEICDDAKVTIVFQTSGENPKTGDTVSLEMLGMILLLSVIGIAVCAYLQNKTRKARE